MLDKTINKNRSWPVVLEFDTHGIHFSMAAAQFIYCFSFVKLGRKTVKQTHILGFVKSTDRSCEIRKFEEKPVLFYGSHKNLIMSHYR